MSVSSSYFWLLCRTTTIWWQSLTFSQEIITNGFELCSKWCHTAKPGLEYIGTIFACITLHSIVKRNKKVKVFGAIWHYDSIQLGSRIGGKVYPRYLQNCWGVHFMHGRHNWQYTMGHNSWLLVMDQNLTDDYFSESGVNVGVSLRNTNNEEGKSNKCNQCNYASFWAGNLKTHLETHSGEKSNKCNQCNFALYYASALRDHMKIHSEDK